MTVPAWLRPRRAVLPTFAIWVSLGGLLGWLGLRNWVRYAPGGGPPAPLWVVLVLAATWVGLAYALASAVATVATPANRGVAGTLFAPDDATLAGTVGALAATVALWLAHVAGLVTGPLGLAVFYVFWWPFLLAGAPLAMTTPPAVELTGPALLAVGLLGVVLWGYALGASVAWVAAQFSTSTTRISG